MQYIYRNSVVRFRKQKSFVLKTMFFLAFDLSIREGVGEDSRHGVWACRHSSRIMYLLECVYVESLHVHLGGE